MKWTYLVEHSFSVIRFLRNATEDDKDVDCNYVALKSYTAWEDVTALDTAHSFIEQTQGSWTKLLQSRI